MAKKKTTKKSARGPSRLQQASDPGAAAASRGAGGLNQARRPEESSRAIAYDSARVAESYGVERELVEALDELEATLGLAELTEESESPRSFAMTEDNQVDASNILGYGVGLKVKNGLLTPTPCVKVYVANKVDPEAITEAKIPEEVGGYPTDVEEIPPIIAYNNLSKCGSGGTVQGSNSYGTIGCLCVRDNKPLILSNNHVIANENQASVGANLESYPSRKWIGNLEDFIPLRQTNDVDAALGWTNTNTAVSPRHRSYSMNPEPTLARLGMTVKKDGARTGFTMGVVKDRMRLAYVSYRNLGTLGFRDVIVIESLFGSYFSQPGDSGSIIVEYSSNRPAALLFAGGGSQTFSSPVQTVVRALRIDRFIGGDE